MATFLKKLILYTLFIFLIVFLLSKNVFATNCSSDGYTVLTINGVFTDEIGARKNAYALQRKLDDTFNHQPLTVDFLHNPSHLAGLGDLVMSAYQKVFDNETVEDYDLVEMLRDASEKVKTQKLLLVAHSQGNFYANSFYDTVAGKKGGVPAESIGVYAVATPSGRVAGGGQWLTSDTDKIIADLVGSMPFKKIMPPNTSIVLAESDDPKGHNFSGVYLKYRGSEIISAIQNSLIRLTENKVQNKESPCLAPPKLTLAHKATGVIFSAVDPAANTSKDAIVIVAAAGYQASRFLAQGVYSLTNLIAGAGAFLLPPQEHFYFSNRFAQEKLVAEDEKPPVKTYSLWVDTEENYSQPATLTGNKFKLAEESLQEMQKQLLAWQNQPPSRRRLDGGVSSESSSTFSSSSQPDVKEARFIASISPGFGGGGTGVASASSADSSSSASFSSSPSESSSSLPADEAGSSSSSSSSSSAGSSSSASESSSSSSSSSSDVTPPTISSLAISECQNSLSSGGCLVATTTLNIAWNSTSTDLAYFAYDQNGTYGTTTATSTVAVAPDNAVFSFAVSARDSAGNFSATSTQTAEISTMPVVINEVAWAGNNAAYSADEWIELYNRTSLAVNLSNWILYSKTDLSPYASLSGTISPRSYYLIERTTDDNTVSDIAADLTASFGNGLSNGGENLALVYKPAGQATTTIDEIPYDYNWYAGSAYSYLTMERYSPDAAGTDASNWGTNNSIIINGHNAGGGNINGTPKARNSYNYLINRGNSVSSNLTLYASSSPYLVDNATQIFNASSTLTIEPGVVIKFYNDAGFSFSGGAKILAQGTPSSPIVFTSFYDDAYGGDTNGNVMAVSPSAGNWFGLRIDSPGAESIISNAVFRYGGKYYSGGGWTDSRANLYIANSSAMISDSVFEYSKVYGAKLSSASGSFSGNTFRYNNNSAEGSSTGLYYERGTLAVNSNAFTNNRRGLYVENAGSANINSNTFTANINEAIYSHGPLGSYANNSGSGNGVDAISLNGTITQSGATTTLAANPLPYLLNGTVTIAASSALVVNSGLTLKGWSIGATSYLNVHGNLIVSGANFSDIVFGSMFSSPAKSNWGGVRFYSGSYSTISGATFEYANTAIAYNDSPLSLANVKFNENNLGVSADAASRNYPISASGITFTNNTATTSPGLW